MSWLDKIFPVKKEVETITRGKKSLKTAIHETSQEVKKGLVAGDPKTWHHIIMGAVIAVTGVMVIAVMFINFLMMQQQRQTESRPIIANRVNSKLPKGDYTIFALMHPAVFNGQVESEETSDPISAFMVSDQKGGVMVVVAPPDGTVIPEEMYGADCYTLFVDDSGTWHFQETDRLKKIREVMKGKMAGAMFQTAHLQPDHN